MFDLGDKNGDRIDLKNSLIEVVSGEGKSVIISVAATVLALLGYEVDVAFDSDYLAKTSFANFEFLFNRLKVYDRVHYRTLNEHCESFLNSRGDIDRRISNFARGLHPDTDVPARTSHRRRVLLIDEADLLFSEKSYGMFYQSVATLRDVSIYELARTIWQNRSMAQEELVQLIMAPCAELAACKTAFPNIADLIDEICKAMIKQVTSDIEEDSRLEFSSMRDEAGFTDPISELQLKKMFAAFHLEKEMGLSETLVKEQAVILLDCGRYSFADIVRCYEHVLGVSGCLAGMETEIREMIGEGKISTFAYSPPIYDQKCDWNPNLPAHTTIVHWEADETEGASLDRYFQTLRGMIADHVTPSSSDPHRGAVLVFFEDESFLEQFYQFSGMDSLRRQTSKLHNRTPDHERGSLVARATTAGRITLLSRSFGRGTDFICFDSEVLARGGILVIQTFLSRDYCEEVLIRGRCARQGQVGIYRLVLPGNKLVKYGLTSEEVEETKQTNNSAYEILHQARARTFSQWRAQRKQVLVEAQGLDKQFHFFLNLLDSNSQDLLRAYLFKKNVF